MRSFESSMRRTASRVGSYSGRAFSSACDCALRSRTQAIARSPSTSSSQRYGSSSGAAVGVVGMGGGSGEQVAVLWMAIDVGAGVRAGRLDLQAVRAHVVEHRAGELPGDA